MIKQLIPAYLKMPIRLTLNFIHDVVRGYWFKYAKRRAFNPKSGEKILLSQALKPNLPKVHNLQIAKQRIEKILILPSEIFSFWQVVGKPTAQNGFQKSRSIVGNRIEQSVGGGLCQLSGLIYYICLLGKVEVLERHAHSIDIYNEETRFTPLGSDATVAYGYKDLKIRNNTDCPIRFSFEIDATQICVALHSNEKLHISEVIFEQKNINSVTVEVDTIREGQCINRSRYKRL